MSIKVTGFDAASVSDLGAVFERMLNISVLSIAQIFLLFDLNNRLENLN